MPGFLPHVDKCCFLLDLKIGTIIICIVCIFGSFGIGGMTRGGLCYDFSGNYHNDDQIDNILNYVLYVCSFVVIISSILVLVYIFFSVDSCAPLILEIVSHQDQGAPHRIQWQLSLPLVALKFACELFSWGALVAGSVIIIIYIIKLVQFYRLKSKFIWPSKCQPIVGALPGFFTGAMWIYCAIVVNSFCGE